MDIHSIIDVLGSDPAGVAKKFNIPLRTVYGWCKGDRTPPDYILSMMNRIILLEKEVEHGKEESTY